jgi:hypothetical protein
MTTLPKRKLLEWAADPFAESTMLKEGIRYKIVKNIPIGSISEQESLQNHARPEASLDRIFVEDYAYKMKKGEVFPMLVLLPSIWNKEKYICAGGNHRYAAMKLAGITHFDAYVVSVHPDLKSVVYDSFPRILNLAHGKAEHPETKMANAIAEVSKGSVSVKDAANRYLVSYDALSQRLKHEEVKVIMEKAGFNAARLSRTKTGLSPLATLELDSVKVAAGTVVVESCLTQEDVRLMVDQLKKAGSENAQLDIVKKWKMKVHAASGSGSRSAGNEEILGRPGSRRTLSRRAQFEKWLSRGDRQLDGVVTLNDLQIVREDDQKEMAVRLNQLIRKLRVLANNVESAE